MTPQTANNCLKKFSFFMAVAAIVAGLGGQLLAGEAIVFGSGKTKVEPGKERSPVQNAFRLDQLTTTSPFDAMSLPIMPQISTNPRKDKRQQNADDEKKNWLILESGELQGKEDERNFLGVRDEKLENLDGAQNSRDYTFRDSTSARAPGQLRAPGQNPSRAPGQHHTADTHAPAPTRESLEEEPDGKRDLRGSAILFGSRGPDDRAANALDLKDLLGGKINDRDLGKSDFSLGGFLNSGDSSQSRERQLDRTREFMTGVLGDPVNRYGDLTRQPVNPMMPSFGESFTRSAPNNSLGADLLTPKPSIGTPESQWNSFSPSLNSGGSGLGAPAAAPGMWRATPVERPAFRF